MVQPWRYNAGEIMLTISITETQALKVLGDFLTSIISAEIIRAPVNLAAMPKADFVAITPKSFQSLSTPINKNAAFNQYITRPAQLVIQLDFYGATAMDNANIVNTSLRDNFAADYFTTTEIDLQTLYCDDAIQLPVISGEAQYIERWSMTCNLQMNPIITTILQTANSLNINVIDAEIIQTATAPDKYEQFFDSYTLSINPLLKVGTNPTSELTQQLAISNILKEYGLQIEPLYAP